LGLRSKIAVNHSNDVRRWSEASGLFANPVERGSVQEFLDLAPDMLNDLVRWCDPAAYGPGRMDGEVHTIEIRR
jgi:hypothetical protein